MSRMADISMETALRDAAGTAVSTANGACPRWH